MAVKYVCILAFYWCLLLFYVSYAPYLLCAGKHYWTFYRQTDRSLLKGGKTGKSKGPNSYLLTAEFRANLGAKKGVHQVPVTPFSVLMCPDETERYGKT